MTSVNELFPSNYFNGADVKLEPFIGLIESVEMKEVGQDKQMVPVVTFSNSPKSLVLNKTNANLIADFLGEEIETWTGKAIELHHERVSFKGKVTDSVRCRKPNKEKF